MKRKLKVKVRTVFTQRMTKQKTRQKKDNIWMLITHHTGSEQRLQQQNKKKEILFLGLQEKEEAWNALIQQTASVNLRKSNKVHVMCLGFESAVAVCHPYYCLTHLFAHTKKSNTHAESAEHTNLFHRNTSKLDKKIG